MSYDEKNYENGISRRKINDEYKYYYIAYPRKNVSARDLLRIYRLKIPPNWENVWISRDPKSAIQVIGRDKKNRKQYIYHQSHVHQTDENKFLRLHDFIKKIPNLDKKLEDDLDLAKYQKDHVIALMLKIVRDYYLRVGKEVYARNNKSYGISSLRKKHVKFKDNVVFSFKGKSGKKLNYTIRDKKIYRELQPLMNLEGDRFFQYIGVNKYGNPKIMKITDRDLNKYIQNVIGDEFTIKDFRTYGSNLYFIKTLLAETRKHPPKNKKIIKKNLTTSYKKTAKKLKHTGAVSKKSYVMNFVSDLYMNVPEIFIENRGENPNIFLSYLLNLYKNIL